MQEVSSLALADVAKTLQLTTGGEQQTEFDDGNLQQVLDVGDMVRRGLVPIGTDGLFGGALETNHIAAGTVSVTIDPYALRPGTDVNPPWPPLDKMKAYDVWVLGALSATSLDTLGVSGGGQFDILYPATRVNAFGFLGAVASRIALFKGESADTVNGVTFLETHTGLTSINGAWRVPRGCTIRFGTNSTGPGTPNYLAMFVVGVFPIGMGQDAIGAR